MTADDSRHLPVGRAGIATTVVLLTCRRARIAWLLRGPWRVRCPSRTARLALPTPWARR